MSGGGNIKVVVRCRPLNSRELARGATCLVRMDGNQTILSKPGNPNDQKAFTFDKSYWSANKNDPDYADQETVYNDLGRELLDHAFHGYNCCIFAYGQTGSGKSYSMMGYEDKGIIPRTCMELFTRIGNETTEERTFQVEVSYIEIYNEKVRDLLNPRNKGNLKVREHPSLGPYVEDLSRLVVNSYEDIDHLMSEGNKARTVAATNMNESSSRSHAVFTIFLTQKHTDKTAKLSSEKVARISLVDLAGSERANSTGATGTRLKEGANINKSLTTLGKVIASLAEQSNDSGKRSSKKSKEAFIPYRDSVLTWLLKDSLGGNSKTAMLAAISPADYDETLSTLRYADQAKKIRNKPVVNEDPNAKLIRELKQELEALRETLKVYAPEEVGKLLSSENKAGRIDAIKAAAAAAAAAATATSASQQQKEPQRITFQGLNGEVKELTKEEVVDQLQSSEKLLNELNETWEEKLSKTEKIHKEREQALEELGIMVEKGNVGVYTPKKAPHLVNLKEDPLMSECLVYKINPGETRVGRLETPDAHIRLSGPNILDQHCVFQNNDGVVTLYPNEGALTMVNGMRILQPKELHSGFRIIIGDYHVFRFNHPEEVRKERDLQRTASVRSSTSSRRDQPLDDQSRPESPAIAIDQESVPTEVIDWNFARREAVLNHYSNEFNFGGLSDEDLEKVFDDISKLRLLRKRTSDIRTDADDESISRTSMSSYRMGTVSTAPTTAEDVTDTLSIDTGHLTTDTEELLRLAREEMQQRLELQKQEYEERLRLVEQANVQSQDLEEEKRSMEEKLQHVKAEMQKLLDDQKKAYESKIKRISLHIPPGICPQSPLYSPVGAGSQMDLARKVIGKWRSLRYVSMAEAILSNAIVIKEANVISKELGKNVVYQFTVVHDDTSANAVSFWESASALQPFGRQADKSLLAETKPCIAVMVTDKQHQVNYIWSLDKIKQRLQLMRSLYDFSEKPQPQRQYFNREDPFYENPCPRFTLIGLARLAIRNLAFQVPIESVVDVICRNTGRVMGQVKVLVAPIARSVARQFPINDNSKHLACLLHIGQQLVFEVRILELIGVTENIFTLVHAQFHLAALRVDSADRVYTTDPISNFGNSVVRFNHSQTISLTVTAGILQNILHGSLVIEVFGRAQPEFLYDKLDWDAEREQEMNTPSTRRLSALSTLQESQEEEEDELAPVNRLLQRRRKSVIDRTDPAEGLLFEERHDIIAWIQILELTPQGDYAPVAVVSQDASDPGCLSLRQGLQRRIKLELIHDSGRQFMWQNISNVTIGNARLVDANGKTIDAGNESHCADVSVQLFPEQTSEYHKNGTAVLCAQGSWDSSLHGSRILNKTTPANQRVLVTLSWQVPCDRCVAPLQFKMDAAIKIYSRDSTTKDNPGMLRSFLGGSTQRKTRKLRSIFVAHLKPPVTRHAKDLWRLNTATKYVRGEEFLGPWKPRSVSLVNDYREARRKMLLREAVSATKHNLVLWERQRSRANRNSRVLELDNTKPISGIIDKDALLRKVMDLWTSQPDKLPDMVISQEPPEELSSPDTPRPEDELEGAAKLNAQVYSVIPSVTTTKRGFLMQPKNGGEEWIKRWFVLKRPYILVYEDQSEAEELGMMNLNNVRVDYKKDLEGLLQRPNVFAVYTCNNAYLLQALDHADMIDWISKIDQFYPVDKLDPQCL